MPQESSVYALNVLRQTRHASDFLFYSLLFHILLLSHLLYFLLTLCPYDVQGIGTKGRL